ncbi:uncharacterized protein HD556DRAFT_1326908 [Suillus plorans]|uniref:Uncharacterized protein n=1 Tax=Suillus plorans TaxID=116603 RepID=A0A9P7J6D9_9AGAM|nr:uncharacterized protein HD556DRAFT_1326908 [Suillus plorans]KAG1804884.1 hypothetical protein HD556DRAFT_1326908 [Suillus plorans]
MLLRVFPSMSCSPSLIMFCPISLWLFVLSFSLQSFLLATVFWSCCHSVCGRLHVTLYNLMALHAIYDLVRSCCVAYKHLCIFEASMHPNPIQLNLGLASFGAFHCSC